MRLYTASVLERYIYFTKEPYSQREIREIRSWIRHVRHSHTEEAYANFRAVRSAHGRAFVACWREQRHLFFITVV